MLNYSSTQGLHKIETVSVHVADSETRGCEERLESFEGGEDALDSLPAEEEAPESVVEGIMGQCDEEASSSTELRILRAEVGVWVEVGNELDENDRFSELQCLG